LFLEDCTRDFAELPLDFRSQIQGRVFCERLFVSIDNRLILFATPFNDAGVAFAHSDAKVHGLSIDETTEGSGRLSVDIKAVALKFRANRLRDSAGRLKKVSSLTPPTSFAACRHAFHCRCKHLST
jgi:hypothetical protein